MLGSRPSALSQSRAPKQTGDRQVSLVGIATRELVRRSTFAWDAWRSSGGPADFRFRQLVESSEAALTSQSSDRERSRGQERKLFETPLAGRNTWKRNGGLVASVSQSSGAGANVGRTVWAGSLIRLGYHSNGLKLARIGCWRRLVKVSPNWQCVSVSYFVYAVWTRPQTHAQTDGALTRSLAATGQR